MTTRATSGTAGTITARHGLASEKERLERPNEGCGPCIMAQRAKGEGGVSVQLDDGRLARRDRQGKGDDEAGSHDGSVR